MLIFCSKTLTGNNDARLVLFEGYLLDSNIAEHGTSYHNSLKDDSSEYPKA